jgi:hypothetical protein
VLVVILISRRSLEASVARRQLVGASP